MTTHTVLDNISTRCLYRTITKLMLDRGICSDTEMHIFLFFIKDNCVRDDATLTLHGFWRTFICFGYYLRYKSLSRSG